MKDFGRWDTAGTARFRRNCTKSGPQYGVQSEEWSQADDVKWMISNGWSQVEGSQRDDLKLDDLKRMISNGWSEMDDLKLDDLKWMISNGWSSQMDDLKLDDLRWMISNGWSQLDDLKGGAREAGGGTGCIQKREPTLRRVVGMNVISTCSLLIPFICYDFSTFRLWGFPCFSPSRSFSFLVVMGSHFGA